MPIFRSHNKQVVFFYKVVPVAPSAINIGEIP